MNGTYKEMSSSTPAAVTHGVPGTNGAGAGSDDERAEEVAVIGHELRNSLAVIRGAARLLRSPDAAEGVDMARTLIERQVRQMSRHIDELVQPVLRGGHRLGLRLSQRDLRLIARHAADGVAPEMTRRCHRFAVKMPGQPVWVQADGARLEQVFSNLLNNAVKYTPDGGDISLTMEMDTDHVFVRIRDSGAGIEPAMLLRVFGMFVQVDASQPCREGGRGIGLAVVQSLVELHRGTVTAMSAGLGRGSEFTVALPIAP